MLNTFFDHIFCLNLARRQDRALWTRDHCSRLGILYELFPAVDGHLLRDIHTRLKFPGTTGNLGATLSHLQIFQTALARGYKNILVIEDDLVYHRDLPKLFELLQLQIPADWEMLYFAWIPVDYAHDTWDYTIIHDTFISPNIFKARSLWSAMAYGITASVMREIVASYEKSFVMEIDRYFVEKIQPTRKVYATWPQLFAGKDDLSDCNDKGMVVPVFQRSHDPRITRDTDFF